MSCGAGVAWTYSGAKNRAFETAQMGACSRDELSYIRSTTRVVLPSWSEHRTFIRAVDNPPPEVEDRGDEPQSSLSKVGRTIAGRYRFSDLRPARRSVHKRERRDHRALPRGVKFKEEQASSKDNHSSPPGQENSSVARQNKYLRRFKPHAEREQGQFRLRRRPRLLPSRCSPPPASEPATSDSICSVRSEPECGQ